MPSGSPTCCKARHQEREEPTMTVDLGILCQVSSVSFYGKIFQKYLNLNIKKQFRSDLKIKRHK